MDATGRLGRTRRTAVRIALAIVALSAVMLIASPDPATAERPEHKGVQFDVRCTHTGSSFDAQGDSVTCAVVVTGLPEPLDEQVTVTLFRTTGSPSIARGSVPSDTAVADEAPAIIPGTPVLVSRHLPAAPPLLPPVSIRVPEPPPKSV